MKRKLVAMLVFCFLGFSISFAQDKKITGLIEDAAGEPIIGASVMVVGTTIGTITDVNGTFELQVPASAQKLTITYVGMKTKEVNVASYVRVVLEENTQEIEEVMVVAYGTSTKKSFVGSATVVRGENIEKKNPTEVSKALAGEIAGVQVVNTSGQPGTNASIRIRGIGSVNASTAPLYVVDGVPYDGDISAIDPSDIASTTVLKDATATSLYGSRGANGVILINTKKGTSGESGKIEVDLKYGANMHLLPMYDVISSPQEYVEMGWMGIYNNLRSSYSTAVAAGNAANQTLFSSKGIPAMYNLWTDAGSTLIDPYTGKFYSDVTMKNGYTNMPSWEDEIFRVGQKMEATVKLHGGTDKTTYYTSFGYLKDEGYYIGSDYSRFTARSNVDHQVKKWLKGNLNMAYSYSSLNNPGQGDNMNNGFNYVNGIPPVYPVYQYNVDGTIATDTKTGGYAYDYGMYEGTGRPFGSGINPAGALQYDKQKTIQHQFSGSAMLEAKIYKDLKFTVNLGMQYVGANSSELTNSYYGDAAGVGRIYKAQTNYISLTGNQLLEYNKQVDAHTIRALAGHEANFVQNSTMSGSMNYIALPDNLEWSNAVQMGSMASATGELAIESYLATASYNYDERYFINGNYRADGSSKFAKGHRWGHFGSVGVAWMLTNEAFMNDIKWLKNTKLRASWGVLGNQGVSQNLYADHYSIENVGDEPSYVWTYKGTEDLTWERTSTVDVGLEFDISKYLHAEIDYFYKLTSNLLFPKYTAPSLGYSYIYVNDGQLSNQGAEFQLNIHAIDTRKVKLDIRLNGGHYTNKMVKMPENIDTGTDMLMNGSMSVGHSLYDWYMTEFAGVDASTGQALYVAYYDKSKGEFGYTSASTITSGDNYISSVYQYQLENPDAVIDTVHTTDYARSGSNYVGKSASPALDGGFGIDLDVYGFNISASFSYRLGGYGYDNTYALLMHSDQVGSYNWHVDMRNAWTESNTNTDVPRLSNGADLYSNSLSTRFLTSNSYLSLNNVRVGYTFPKKWMDKIKLSSLSVWVSGDNLCVLSARKGYNPTVSYSGTSDSYQYTPLSTVIGGIKLSF